MLLLNALLCIYLPQQGLKNITYEKPRRRQSDLIAGDSHISNAGEVGELFKES